MGKVKSYYLDEDYDISVNPEFDDFDWDTPIKEQPWYTPPTEVNLDRDVPDNPFSNDIDIEDYEDWVSGHIGEPEYLGDR
jgi:hypothetical protein